MAKNQATTPEQKNPIRSMTNVENQAPASMWRMSVAPMMDWIDSRKKSLSDSNLEAYLSSSVATMLHRSLSCAFNFA